MGNSFPVPLNALHAIEVVARLRALAPAAAELGVTPGAVSQHIRRAEERLGILLFERTPQGLVPTELLTDLLPMLRSGFQSLAEVGQKLQRGRDCVLTVTVGNVFASRWLVWRMARFAADHPDIELRLVISGNIVDFGVSDIDCGIRFGHGNWSGMRADPIGGTTFQPVCAPPVAAQLRTPLDIAKTHIIRDEGTMLSWAAWWKMAGVDDPPEVPGPYYTDPAIAFDAAISEQGVLLAVDMMSADAVSDGRLVRPFDLPASNDTGYFLVTPDGRSLPQKVRVFRDWLTAEVPASACGYVGQLRGQQKRLMAVEPGTKAP